MTKRLCSNEIWTKDWFLELPDKKKLLVKFLYDNCDCAGFYEISYRVLNMCFENGVMPSDFEGLKQVRFVSENVIFLEDFIKFQYNIEISELNPKINVHKGILRKLSKYGIFSTLPQGLIYPCPRVQDKDKDKDKVKDKDKDKDKDNNINNININNNNNEKIEEKKEKKIDPLFDKRVQDFITEYKKYLPLYNTTQNRKLIAEVVADETLDVWIEVFKKSKNKGHIIDGTFKPLSLNSILKNYSKILEGTYKLTTNPKVKELNHLNEFKEKIKEIKETAEPMPEIYKKLGEKLKRKKYEQ